MPMMMAIAVKQMGMTPAEAINAATINAAHALGLERWVGSFVCDKQADVLILNVSDYRELSHCFGMNPVALVIRAGEEIYPRVETV
jgi:imidazolonepropionase